MRIYKHGETSVKRSGWVTGTIVMQLLWALALIGISVYLIVLAHISASRNGPGAAEAASGLKIAALTLFLPALLATISWYGLWKRKPWGWWLAVVANLAVMSILVYSMIDDGWSYFDWDLAGLTLASAVIPILLLLPVVRKFYRRVAATEPNP
jgi:uncharacterized membrane protein (DUF2068 family)